MLGDIDMYDAITVGNLPAGAGAYGAYVGGQWPTYNTVRARFPGARVLSIAISDTEAAECLDIEFGDAQISQAPGWNRRARLRGVTRPGDYAEVSRMAALWAGLTSAGEQRHQVRLWSAHYGLGPHICGPATCAYRDAQGRMVPECDGTQWTSTARGMNLDQSLLRADFFDAAVAPPLAPGQEDDVYHGQIDQATQGVPVVKGTTTRCCLFADFTTPEAPIRIRVAVLSAARGYSQITTVTLGDSRTHYVLFEQPDVEAVSFRRLDTLAVPGPGYFIT